MTYSYTPQQRPLTIQVFIVFFISSFLTTMNIWSLFNPQHHCPWLISGQPHQCCIGSFLITFAVRLDTVWWIMARVDLIWVMYHWRSFGKCGGDYTQTERQTQTLTQGKRRQISPWQFKVPTYRVLGGKNVQKVDKPLLETLLILYLLLLKYLLKT